MKEIMAVVRLNKVEATKEALAKAGFPAFTCRKVMGRGKKSVGFSMADASDKLPLDVVGESLSEKGRLIPKRVFTLIVRDEDVEDVVHCIISSNKTGNPGDGKVFVLPILDAYRVRDGKAQTSSESY